VEVPTIILGELMEKQDKIITLLNIILMITFVILISNHA
jgi:hypothetical protein